MNCIYNATYNGSSLDGARLYVWGLPVCSECAKGIIQVGISEVFWSCNNSEIPEKWWESLKITKILLDEAGVNVINLNREI